MKKEKWRKKERKKVTKENDRKTKKIHIKQQSKFFMGG